MAMSEDEARKRWCPHVRVHGSNALSSDRMPEWSYCIGSNCMMWQWAQLPQTPIKTSIGYCGLTTASQWIRRHP